MVGGCWHVCTACIYSIKIRRLSAYAELVSAVRTWHHDASLVGTRQYLQVHAIPVFGGVTHHVRASKSANSHNSAVRAQDLGGFVGIASHSDYIKGLEPCPVPARASDYYAFEPL